MYGAVFDNDDSYVRKVLLIDDLIDFFACPGVVPHR